MRSSKFEILAIILVVIFAGFLYLYKLDSVPVGLYVDEAVSGYNAYSLLTTGKDEYGKVFPIALRFFGSYSPPLYTYLTIPIIALRGLSVSSIRLVSVICGVLSVLLFYVFLKSLNIVKNKLSLIISTLLFAVSPWIIFYSRVGYELYLGFFIFFLGTFFVWLGLKKPIYLTAGFTLLSLSTYTAHPQQILTPLFVLGVIIFFHKKIFNKNSKKYLYLAVLIAALLQIPHLTIITTPALFSKTSLFYKDVVLAQAEKIQHYLPLIVALPLSLAREFFSQYLTYFSPRSLFFLPDADPQRSMPELSVFYPWMIILYFIGLYMLWKRKDAQSHKYIILLALLSALPASIAGNPFSTQRALPLVAPLMFTMAIGLDRLILKLKPIIWLPFFLFFLFTSFLLLWRSYFVFLPKERAKIWGYGFPELAEMIKANPDSKFLIDQSRTKPVYIQLAFYLKYPPEKFHQEVDQSIARNYYTNVDFSDAYKFANIETRNINWQEDIYKEQILVGDELAISENQAKEHFLTKVFEIRDPIDQIIFQGYKTNPKAKCLYTRNLSPFCSLP